MMSVNEHYSTRPVPLGEILSSSTDGSANRFDVVIVGAGPAGLMANLCLKTFGFKVLQLDNRPEPTVCGRADGIQPRTIEILRNTGRFKPIRSQPIPTDPNPYPEDPHLGIAKRLIAQGVRVYEVAFWDPTETKLLARTSRARSCPDFVDIRDQYTLLLHQGLIERCFLKEIADRASSTSLIRPVKFITCSSDPASSAKYPVRTEILSLTSATTNQGIPPKGDEELCLRVNAHTENSHQEKFFIESKYLLGCDGARSDVRKSLGDRSIFLEGEGHNNFWAVMDCWVQSDFPDLKLKCLIHSKASGSIMVIPRENNMVRFYVQLKTQDHQIDRASTTIEFCQKQAKEIFAPYELNFGKTDWFSVYEIAQRIANKYTLDGRVILGGDAVHTHSPKAGQGMNVSMIDMYSLAWKINLIEKGLGRRKEIMETYESERRGVALELLAFDSEYASLFSGQTSLVSTQLHQQSHASALISPDTVEANQLKKVLGDVDPEKFIKAFQKHANFASGCGAVYSTNVFNAMPDSDLIRNSSVRFAILEATKLSPGKRLLPGDVTRVIDGNPVRLEQEIKMDGSFRIYIFIGNRPVGDRCNHLQITNKSNFLNSSQDRNLWEISDLPQLFADVFKEHVYLDNRTNRIAGQPNSDCTLHSKYGIDEEGTGGIVICRPDGYVGLLVDLNPEGWKIVEGYFDTFLIDQSV